MSDPLSFDADTGARELWLFTLSVSNDEIGGWEPPRADNPNPDWALQDALAVGSLDRRHVFVFEASDLGPHGLKRYLVDAHGMDEGLIEADAERLDRIHGSCVVVLSGALSERPGRFTVEPPVWFIGHYTQAYDLAPAAAAAPREATLGHLPGASGPGADPARLRRFVVITLAALAAAALAVWALV